MVYQMLTLSLKNNKSDDSFIEDVKLHFYCEQLNTSIQYLRNSINNYESYKNKKHEQFIKGLGND